ncbi:protein phosphatase 2C domain-containing protein [Acuticoccus sp. MNP-M23]|uniref:protein phosphatase 2C domain-containing protein n=1 Tax=Acuticoccus sp. MNP-M23 TaxID=3072793 RepID=UPI0028164B84|nr:protein phosphatase 2C domain-containing protein [Acuticoccus sp. MNP-M23]WMS40987.1 protein phosphatase 2C domain-containing protein [Acuticoccus sp. MNP-M23]
MAAAVAAMAAATAAVPAAAVGALPRPMNPTTTISRSDTSVLHTIEQLSAPGKPGRPNEDGCGAAGAYAWIIDGATGLADAPLLDAPSDAAWLTAAIHLAFTEHADAPTPDALLARANRAVAARFAAERIRAPEHRYEIPAAAFLLVRDNGDHIEIAELGDCATIVADATGCARYGGTEEGRAREQTNAASIMHGSFERTPAVLANLRASRNQANAPGGFPIFAPGTWDGKGARIHRHPLAPTADALLMTDGYFAAVVDYALFDPPGLMAAAQDGLAGPLAQIRATETADADNTRFPRFKQSDDATALLVRFDGVQA